MIYYILLSVSLCLGVAKNIISKWGEKSFGFLNGLMSVNIMTSIVALAVFSSGITGIKSAFAPLFIVMALIYGLLTLGSQSLYITAVKSGSVSVCSLIYASCFVIPTVYSVIRNGETISLSKLFGIILMLFSVVLVSLKKAHLTKALNTPFLQCVRQAAWEYFKRSSAISIRKTCLTHFCCLHFSLCFYRL